MLGYVPDGQAQAVAAGSPLATVAQGPLEDHVVVRELVNRIAFVSQDVLIEVVRTLEEQLWMLRVQLGCTCK